MIAPGHKRASTYYVDNGATGAITEELLESPLIHGWGDTGRRAVGGRLAGFRQSLPTSK
ncbi:hypothetical protein ACFY3N_20290 [Streptomyces sp. NPDC000348]|uniref:hypothetical protein n=1 Tax=Streptomyces sp. NPDC000348 TaxID=3364538 RepID=UPI0036B05582